MRLACPLTLPSLTAPYALIGLISCVGPGFDHSVLCEFRSRLLEGSAEERLLGRLLDACRARGLLKARGRQRTDSTGCWPPSGR